MGLVEKTELLKRLSLYVLSKIHFDRNGSFREVLLILSWDINFNPGLVHGIQNEIYNTHFCFMIVVFPEVILRMTRMYLKKEEGTLFT